MKRIYQFCTRVMVYWIVIPLAVILAAAIYFNTHSTALLKLYPLIVLSAGAIIFVLIYFFRMITLGYDEIRYIGLFSSRDRAVITEGKTLSLILMTRGIIKVLLIGNDTQTAGLDWIKNDEPLRDICLFRGKMLGGKRTVRKILRFYGASDADVNNLFHEECFVNQLENVTVSNAEDDGYLQINIRFDKTV